MSPTSPAPRRVLPPARVARAVTRGEAGFSLLEVLIAFAIASLALTALLQLYSTSATSSKRSVDMATAVEIADNRLAMLEDPAFLVPGETSGTAADGYTWRMQIAPEPEAAPPDGEAASRLPPLQLLLVTVSVDAPRDEPGRTAAQRALARPILTVRTARAVRREVR